MTIIISARARGRVLCRMRADRTWTPVQILKVVHRWARCNDYRVLRVRINRATRDVMFVATSHVRRPGDPIPLRLQQVSRSGDVP